MSEVTTNTVNRPLLLEVLAYIEKYPEKWDQDTWAELHPEKPWVPDDVCGTTFCFAGHVLVREGYVPLFDDLAVGEKSSSEVDAVDFIPVKLAKKLRKAVKKGEDVDMDDIYHQSVSAPRKAQELLGLTWEQADRLFNSDNDIERIRTLVFRYISE